jgi:hypothetical protein
VLEERIVGVGLGEGDLVGVGQVEVVEGEDDGGEAVRRGLEGGLDYRDLNSVRRVRRRVFLWGSVGVTRTVLPAPWTPFKPRKKGGASSSPSCCRRWTSSRSRMNGIQYWDLSSSSSDMVVGHHQKNGTPKEPARSPSPRLAAVASHGGVPPKIPICR